MSPPCSKVDGMCASTKCLLSVIPNFEASARKCQAASAGIMVPTVAPVIPKRFRTSDSGISHSSSQAVANKGSVDPQSLVGSRCIVSNGRHTSATHGATRLTVAPAAPRTPPVTAAALYNQCARHQSVSAPLIPAAAES